MSNTFLHYNEFSLNEPIVSRRFTIAALLPVSPGHRGCMPFSEVWEKEKILEQITDLTSCWLLMTRAYIG